MMTGRQGSAVTCKSSATDRASGRRARRYTTTGHSAGKAGAYLITGAGGNTTARLTSQGWILVDAKPRAGANYEELMALIKGSRISRSSTSS